MSGTEGQGAPASDTSLNLGAPPPGHVYSVTIEPDEKDADRYIRLLRETLLFLLGFGIATASVVYCTHLLFGATSPEQKKWAMSVLWGSGGGLGGYLLGIKRK